METSKSGASASTIVLSRFFDSNVRMVAGVCSKCYLEEEDLKIVGVNRKFLKNTKRTAKKFLHKVPPDVEDDTTIDHCQNDRLELPATISTEDNYALITTTRASLLVCKETIVSGDSPTYKNNTNPESVSKFLQKVKFKHETCNEDVLNTQKINLSCLKTQNSSKFPLWSPPRSPHNLIEESLFRDPWSLLVATIFLNKTSCRCARPRVEEFLKDFSGPWEVLKKNPSELEKYFLDLGLYKKRAEQVWRMSYDYVHKNWKKAKELYGIGKYGEDAYRMFVLGDLEIEPTDRFLRIYRDWAKMKEKEEKRMECEGNTSYT